MLVDQCLLPYGRGVLPNGYGRLLKACGGVLRLFLLLQFLDSVAFAGIIHLKNETINTATAARLPKPLAITQPLNGLYLVEFTNRFNAAWEQELQGIGVELLQYLPDNAFVVRLRNTPDAALRGKGFINWLGNYEPRHKIQGKLGRLAVTNTVQVKMILSSSTSASELTQVRALLGKAVYHGRKPFGQVVSGTLPLAKLPALAASPAVLWIEPGPQPKLVDEISARIVDGDIGVVSRHGTVVTDLGFDGRGVIVAVADSGLNNGDAATMHPDLLGRVDAFHFYGKLEDASDEHGHGTHVAGIVGGNGATGETDDDGYLYGLGVAPGAHIVAQRIFDGAGGYEPPASNETLTHDAVRSGAVIGSNSWGDDTQGAYDINAAEFDALVRDADATTPGDQPYILEFSAGNAGPGAQTIGSPAVGKNVIASGAAESSRTIPDLDMYADGFDTMADFSSRGPTEDGRIKPDVVAPGTWIASLQSQSASSDNAWLPISENYQYEGGTSQSGPHVSGTAAVFVQYYRETHGNVTPSPALVKAALINSAVDMDDQNGDTGPAPNFDEGWGRVDLTELITTEKRHDFVDQTALLKTGDVFERRVIVASGEQSLKITLAYTDVPGFPGAIPTLVNDLDLEVVGPNGEIYHGNQFEGAESVPNVPGYDSINNVEGMHLAVPSAGEYLVRVIGRNVVRDSRKDTAQIDQDFALVISGDLPLPGVGTVILNQASYRLPDVMKVRVVDLDLAGQAQITVVARSTSEPLGEVLILKAAGNYGAFTGQVALATGTVKADGILQAKAGDSITVIYADQSPQAARTASAVIDLTPPVISQVVVTNHFAGVSISWQTDEATTSVVYYGTNQFGTNLLATRIAGTESTLPVGNLLPGVKYYFAIVSRDEAGNLSTNNNGGQWYPFTTRPSTPPLLIVDAYVSDGFFDDIPLSGYTDPLDQLKVSYDVWSTVHEGKSPGTNELKGYQAVVWRVNDSFGSSTSISPADQTAITTYVRSGGGFLLASMELLSRLGATAFVTNILQVTGFVADVGVPGILGRDGDPITAGMGMELDYSLYPTLELLDIGPDLSDTLTITPNAAPIFFDSVTDRIAGLRYPRSGLDATGRVVFLSFPLDAVPLAGAPPDNRANLWQNLLSFLAPELQTSVSVALDRGAYTVPSLVVVELTDGPDAGSGRAITRVNIEGSTATNGFDLPLVETARRGVFRGAFTLVGPTNKLGQLQLPGRDGDVITVLFTNRLTSTLLTAEAVVDTQTFTITGVTSDVSYEEATVSWTTSKPTDALVQFGESKFLGRTAYSQESAKDHQLTLTGLVPDKDYYFQVVSRDEAGNTVTDDRTNKLYLLHTAKPTAAPWSDNLDKGPGKDWSVDEGQSGGISWQFGPPNNSFGKAGFTGTNVWATNPRGDSIAAADTTLLSPAISLVGGNHATLKFYHTYDFSQISDSDVVEQGDLVISTNLGGSWASLAQYADASDGWEQEIIDLTPYVGHVVQIGWTYTFLTFEGGVHPGWMIDDVSISLTNVTLGSISISNNISQAGALVTGPTNFTVRGPGTLAANIPLGTYVVRWDAVPYYVTPPNQTNALNGTNTIFFTGNYSFPDANHNGISDLWEQAFFGRVDAVRDPNQDSDGDGASDYAEFVTGTNPTNAASVLRLNAPVALRNRTVKLDWPAVPGHAYVLQGSTNLMVWLPYSAPVLATATNASVTLPALDPKAVYYFRLSVKP